MENRQNALTEINLTSLVDVCLTLVIVFMASSPFMLESSIRVSAPSGQRNVIRPEFLQKRTAVYIKSDGALLVNGKTVDFSALKEVLRSQLKQSKNHDLLLAADDNVSHEHVIEVIDQAKLCGVAALYIVKSKSNMPLQVQGNSL